MGIGFFAPLPLAMMLPFMAGQSMIMGESFGKGFQYGKRKISSMSNEEFNAMTADDLGRELATDYTAIIPHLEQAVRASSDFQQMIIQELIKIIPNFVDQLLGGGTAEQGGTGSRLPPAGIPAFLTPIIGPPPQTILENPQINPPNVAAPGISAQEQFASRWIDVSRKVTNFNTITIKEARYILNLFSAGYLKSMFFARAPLIKKWESLQPIPKTPAEAITASGATGNTLKIATMYNQIVSLLLNAGPRSRAPTAAKSANAKKALLLMRAYNIFVAGIRKPKLQLDTAKSMAAFRPIPKT